MQHLSTRSLKIIILIGLILGCIICFGLGIVTANAGPATDNKVQHTSNKAAVETLDLPNQFFILLLSLDPIDLDEALGQIRDNWTTSLIPFALETIDYSQSSYVRRQLIELIESSAPEHSFESNNDIYQWLWNQKITSIEGYANFKAGLYSTIDSKFETYFKDRQASARIRLDEIRWGGRCPRRHSTVA